MRQMPTVLKRLLIVSACVIAIGMSSPSYSTDSKPAASDSVVLTVAEADSILDLIDDQALEIRLLQIDVRTLRQLSREDSLRAARLLDMQERHYEEMLEMYKRDREHWLVRSMKHPALWFMVGAWAGLQVTGR